MHLRRIVSSGFVLVLVGGAIVAACGGEKLPASSARPVGEMWFCAQSDWSACGRSDEDCAVQNARVGSRVVGHGQPPAPEDCKKQDLATCYTFFDPTVGKTLYDCFRNRIECEGYRKEAERAPAQHQDLSVCGTWD